jgi:hypothetical protein
MGLIVSLAFTLVPFSVGVVAVVWPERIQDYALKYYSRHTLQAKLNPFLGWMTTRSYRISLRCWGVVMIAVPVFLWYVVLSGKLIR